MGPRERFHDNGSRRLNGLDGILVGNPRSGGVKESRNNRWRTRPVSRNRGSNKTTLDWIHGKNTRAMTDVELTGEPLPFSKSCRKFAEVTARNRIFDGVLYVLFPHMATPA